MPVHEEDDFELVLGNRQLFFLAVVLFGVFFSIGYTVGYSRGRESADEVSAATRQPPVTEPAASLTPRNASVPQEPLSNSAAADPASAGAAAANRAASDSTRLSTGASALAQSNSAPGGKSQPARSTSPASAVRPPAAAAATPAGSAAATPAGSTGASARSAGAPARGRETANPRAAATTAEGLEPRPSARASQATIAVPAIKPGAIYLQVLASREAGPARDALLEIKAKGHPVTLDNIDPAWYRILVGPFDDEESAAQYQLRLQQEKIDSFIRKL